MPLLSIPTATALVQATFILYLDFCNNLPTASPFPRVMDLKPNLTHLLKIPSKAPQGQGYMQIPPPHNPAHGPQAKLSFLCSTVPSTMSSPTHIHTAHSTHPPLSQPSHPCSVFCLPSLKAKSDHACLTVRLSQDPFTDLTYQLPVRTGQLLDVQLAPWGQGLG